MPIEPTSVSKPVVREIEQSSSGSSPWSFAQGSSTGGKDRHISSIWEKAISGAQRLFGSEKSDEQAVDEESESKGSSSRDEPSENTRASLTGPGFGGRGLGRYGFSAGVGNAFMSVGGSLRANELPEPPAAADAWRAKDESRPVASIGCVGDVDHQTEQSERARRSEEGSRDDDSEERNKAKAKTSTPVGLAPVAPRPLPTLTSTGVAPQPNAAPAEAAAVLSVGEVPARTTGGPAIQTVQAPPSSESLGIAQPSAATQAPQAASQPTSRPIAPASESPTPESLVTNSRQVTQNQSKPDAVAEKAPPAATPAVVPVSASNPALEGSMTTTRGSAASESALPSTSAPARESSAGSLEVKPALAPQQTLAKAVASPGSESESSSLSFDLQKGKDAVSETLTRQIRQAPTPAANPVASTPAIPAVAHSLGGESAALKPVLAESPAPAAVRAEGLSGDAKDATLTDASRKDVAVSQAARTAAGSQSGRQGATVEQSQPALENANAAAGAAKTASQFAVSTSGQSSSNAAAAASRAAGSVAGLNGQPAAPTAANANPAVAGVSAAQPAAGLGLTSQSQQSGSQMGSEGGAAKQDFGSTLQNASSSTKGADTQQSFDVKTLEGESTRRAEVVSKTRQSSYVTKTAEEMKEVVAAMSKSVESLATNKGGAMTLKLNFEQGGSMTLRVSMEGGQVSTTMQTDVGGLEAAIKSHWAELASDWNQKGIKLNVPQFQQGALAHGDADSRADQWTELSQRQERGAQSFFGSGGRQGGGRESSASRQGSAATGTPLNPNTGGAVEASDSGPIGSVPEREWKTYA